jgi:hypothetical protein
MTTTKTLDYERLPEVVEIGTIGIPGMTATLVRRTDKKAMYKRWDGTIEVFRVKIKEEGEVFGKTYPKREVYPQNEDFGSFAWCYQNEASADLRYNNLP